MLAENPQFRSRRIMLAGAAALALIALVTGAWAYARSRIAGAANVDAGTKVDPAAVIGRLASGMSATGPYRDPSRAERSRAVRAVRLLLAEPDNTTAHDKAFRALGFAAHHGTDPVTGRPFSLFITAKGDDRAWGAILVDRSTRPWLVVEVPHPVFDINTEEVGIATYRHIPGSVLLVAGAHRDAAGGRGDVAHNDRSMFHVIATEFAREKLPQVQLHGFADDTFPEAQVIVSTGAAPSTETARDVASALRRAGPVTCRAWADHCGPLEGTTNEQGRAAQAMDAPFIHLELNWSLRRDPIQREIVATAIGEAFRRR